MLNFICLFYPDADANTVDAWFYQDFLVLIASNGQGVEKYFRRARGLYFRHIMPFCRLGRKIGQ